MSQAKEDIAKACDYCGRTGEMKARATQGGDTRLFCHTAWFSCYNACRGRYFEPCTCDKEFWGTISAQHDCWVITHQSADCQLHISPVPL